MKTILVPLDGSPLAERVLPHVRALAPALGAHVRLLRVIPYEQIRDLYPTSALLAYGVSDEVWEEHVVNVRANIRRTAETYLVAMADQLRAESVHVETMVREGNPAELIVETSEDTDLIVMATHNYTGIKRWTLGSVTEKVAHTSHVPVLVVRGSEAIPSAPPSFKTIMVPLDGSALSRQAVPLAVELATALQARLIPTSIVTVALDERTQSETLWKEQFFSGTLETVLMDELRPYTETLREKGIAITPLLGSGLPAEAIVDEAQHYGVDLIVMATHGYSGLRRWALGSVADKVLHSATTPVLLVRARKEHKGDASASDRRTTSAA